MSKYDTPLYMYKYEDTYTHINRYYIYNTSIPKHLLFFLAFIVHQYSLDI